MVIMLQRPSLQSTRDDERPSSAHPTDDVSGATRPTHDTVDDRRPLDEPRTLRQWLGTAMVYVAAAGVGAVMAVITVMNLHILAGLYEGWAATPAQVLEYSPVLAAVDVVILVGGPVLMVASTWWVRRRLATGPEPAPER